MTPICSLSKGLVRQPLNGIFGYRECRRFSSMRRFRAPWTVEAIGAGFKVIDANGQDIAAQATRLCAIWKGRYSLGTALGMLTVPRHHLDHGMPCQTKDISV